MDNSTTGGNDKRSWRERLGIGTKELPKISDDFKTDKKPVEAEAQSAGSPPPPGVAKVAPRAPVTRPAPMAPRPAAKAADAATPVAANGAGPMAKPIAPGPRPSSPPRPMQLGPASRPVSPPTSPPGPNPDTLANRLKAQREAAEKLAEQRIQAARQRAEASARNTAAPQPVPTLANDAGRPKFAFADDEPKLDPTTQPPQLRQGPQPQLPPQPQFPMGGPQMAPPRPSLGAERAPMPPRMPVPPPQPKADPAGYRPVDPATGYAPPPFNMPRSYPGQRMPPRPVGVPPPEAPSAYVPPDDYGFEPAPATRQMPRPMGRPAAPSTAAYGTDADDIFEQPLRTARRPNVTDYNRAYRDAEAQYEEEPPNSSLPWLLLLGLLLAFATAAAGVWYYQSYLKPQPVATVPATPQEQVPVVSQPETPAKVESEQLPGQAAEQSGQTNQAGETGQATGNDSGGLVVQPTSKKQIYDRIVGDREVLGGEMIPTEEPAVTPDPAAAPADAPPVPEAVPPPGDGQQGSLPAPPGTTNETNSEIGPAAGESQAAVLPEPGVEPQTDPSAGTLPEPIPQPAGTNSTIEPDETSTKDMARLTAAAADEELVVPAPQGTAGATTASQGNAATASQTVTQDAPPQPAEAPKVDVPTTPPAALAVPKKAASSDTALLQPDTDTVAPDPSEGVAPEAEAQAPAKPEAEAKPDVKQPDVKQVVDDPDPTPAKPKVTKKAAQKAAKPKPKAEKLGTEPVVLVPPAEGSSAAAGDGIYGELPAGQSAAAAEPAPKKRTLLDLLNNRNSADGQQQQQAQPVPQQPEQQVARAEPAQQPDQTQSTSRQATSQSEAGSGYVVQLATFRSKAEAEQEYARMRSKHGATVANLSAIVSEASVGGSTRYRLGLGPMASRAAASQVCSKLFSAGERDCLVRRR